MLAKSSLLLLFAASAAASATSTSSVPSVSAWSNTSSGPYSAREGLMGVSHNGSIFLSGGRERYGTGFSSEVYRSDDDGLTFALVSKDAFPERAYHSHVVVGDCQLIFGGQTFFTFYNDVWKSCGPDAGSVWTQVTPHAPFPARAGLATTTTASGAIILAGGCYNKNNNPARRSFYGDVWTSLDGGETWAETASSAGWIARSGARIVEVPSTNELLLIAGEIGFTPETQLKDVWSSTDGGKTWVLKAAEPGFSARSGHGVVVLPDDRLLVVAGWPHLHDLYESTDGGLSFDKTSDSVWNCQNDDCGKFDFWPILHKGDLYTVGGSAAYSTFGKLWQDTWRGEIESSATELLSRVPTTSYLRGS